MQRRIVALATAILAAATPTVTALGQEPDDGSVLLTVCATVSGSPPKGAWDAASLQAALEDGTATLEVHADEALCRGGDTADAGPGPLPIEIVDTHLSKLGDTATFLTIIANPNTEGWSVSMPIRFDVLNGKGKRVGFEYGRLELAPGQTGVLTGIIPDAKGAKSLEVIPAGHREGYVEADGSEPVVELHDISTKTEESGGVTTTGVISGVPGDVIGVTVTAVYRDRRGTILGFGSAYLPGAPADGTPFEVQGFVEGRIADTETFSGLLR